MIETKDRVISLIDELIRLGKKALQNEKKLSTGRTITPDYLEGPYYTEFKSKLKLFTERYLRDYPLYDDIYKARKSFLPIMGCQNIIQHLETIKSDEVFFERFEACDNSQFNNLGKEDEDMSNSNIFVVYGHNQNALDEVELFLRRINCNPIILKNEPSGGLTIIEKIEEYSQRVSFAIVLYTACDEGRLKEKNEALKARARQNVVFEHGYLISKLSRKKVVALVEENVETPGDVSGVIYVSMASDDWRQQIMKEMQNAGMVIDNGLNAGTGRIKNSNHEGSETESLWGKF